MDSRNNIEQRRHENNALKRFVWPIYVEKRKKKSSRDVSISFGEI